MKKFWIQIIVLMLGTFAAIYFGFNPTVKLPSGTQQSSEVSTKKLKIEGNELTVEIADTPQLRAKGLGEREALGNDFGMLFVFDKSGKYSFWMKGMRFGLDFIFVDSGVVVDLLTNVANPASWEKDENLAIYQPKVPVNMVLEVQLGYVTSHNIKVGDRVYLVN